MDLHLRISPVFSELHSDQKIGSRRLLRHQVETFEAFQNPAIDVIFNTAMTGDGKSLAAYLPAFQEGLRVIAAYPTNELIRDQYMGLANYQKMLGIQLPRYDTMYGEKITELQRKFQGSRRFDEVRKLLKYNPILLTNPDLVHLIMSHQYGWEHLRKELPAALGGSFDYLLFDEFHVFEIPQVIAVMNLVNYLDVHYRDNQNERKKFVFLSATPSTFMNNLLSRSGLRYKTITGHYRFSKQEGYHQILQPCALDLHDTSKETPSEEWIIEHIPALHNFFKQYPNSKAAIIVSSVATARRLVLRLKEYFEPLGISVGENTGLTDRVERESSRDKQILVGTSTIDIGVDFHINYLIFEAFSAGSFLQRFGRLGRHPEFDVCQAHALLPRFVLERLKDRFVSSDELERTTFNQAIQEAFPTEQEFAGYLRLWGVMQAAQVLAELQQLGKLDQNHVFTEALQARYEQMYKPDDNPVMPRAMKRHWRLALNSAYKPIVEELQSFRGQSLLTCGDWDSDNTLKTYDLLFLVANTDCKVIPKADFMREVALRKLDPRPFENVLLYLKINEYVPERQNLVLGQLTRDLEEKLHEIRAISGFTVREPRLRDLDQINRSLKPLNLACIMCPMELIELKGKYHLGTIFPLFRVQDKTGSNYTVAFGQNALLLDSILRFRRPAGEKPIMA